MSRFFVAFTVLLPLSAHADPQGLTNKGIDMVCETAFESFAVEDVWAEVAKKTSPVDWCDLRAERGDREQPAGEP